MMYPQDPQDNKDKMEENKGPSQTKDDTDRMHVELEFSKAQVQSLE